MKTKDIKRIVEWVLTEDDGGDWGGDWGGGDGYGGGNVGDLYRTFIQPFADVFETAASVVETGMSKAQLLTGIAVHGLMSLVFPFAKPKYDEMIAHDSRRVSQIMRKYSKVFERTEKALTSVGGDYDGAGIFFVLFPDAVIARNMVKYTATRSEETAKMAADTVFDFLDAVTFNATGPVTDPLRKQLDMIEHNWLRGEILLEAEENDERAEKIGQVVNKVLSSPKIQKLLSDSNIIKSMQTDGLSALEGTLKDAIKPIRQLRSVDSVADIERLTGKKLDLNNSMKVKQVDPDDFAIQQSDLERAVEDVLPNIINQAAEPFIKRLNHLKGDIETLAKQYGVTDRSSYREVISRFNEALKELED